jgi:hypothetical protein
LTLLAQGGVQAIPDIVRKLIQLAIAIELDGFARGVKKHLAMSAALEMHFQGTLQVVVDVAVQVVRYFLENLFAIHRWLTSIKNLA